MGRCVYICGALALSVMACVEPRLPSPDAPAPDAGPFHCTPMTCTGCCEGNVCLGGNLDTACGYDGRRCQACETGTACVSPGACVSLPHDGGFDTPFNPDGGTSQAYLMGPTGRPDHCLIVFWRLICF